MGGFQASIMEAMQSLRDEIKSVKKTNLEVGVDQTPSSDPKPGPSKQPDDLPISPNTQPNIPWRQNFVWLENSAQVRIRSEFRTIGACLFS